MSLGVNSSTEITSNPIICDVAFAIAIAQWEPAIMKDHSLKANVYANTVKPILCGHSVGRTPLICGQFLQDPFSYVYIL